MFLLIIFVTATVCNHLANGACTVSIKDLRDPQPLLLRNPAATEPIDAFYLPNDSGDVSISTVLHIECPGGNIKLKSTDLRVSTADLTCKSGKTFTLNGQNVDISMLTCTVQPTKLARYTGRACLGTYKHAEIGFVLGNRNFIKHMELCFDDRKQTTLYSFYILTSAIEGYQRNYARPDFTDTGFFSMRIADLYTKDAQRKRINALVGLRPTDTKYVQNQKYYLARGHLTAKTDFIYGSEQRLTFYYINAVPQWQENNCGAWSALENNVANYASRKRLNLQVYTGSQGIMTLPHEQTHANVEIYLYEANNVKAVPVPKFMWKVVYDPVSRAGVAFVTVNNPYVRDPPICTDICSQLTWVTFAKNCGSYCCSVADMRRIITNMPAITVSRVLV